MTASGPPLAELAGDRGGHAVAWTLRHESVTAEFTCTNEAGAWCRSWCGVGCDERCTAPAVHPTEDTGSCFAVPYLNDSGVRAEEVYGGDDTPLRDGPVDLAWQDMDEYYQWTYTELVVS